jgi:flavin reductase
MSHFASGVTVVTALAGHRAHAMAATAVCAVSLEPPLILVCVSHTARFHAAVTSTDHWAVSILADDQSALARHFSRRGRALETQFDDVAHHPAPISGAPVLDGCLVWLDCRTHAVHDGGDHSIVVGELLATGSGSGDESAAPPPLTYYRGLYHVGPLHPERVRGDVPEPGKSS